MDAAEKTINLFSTRVRQMIIQYKDLKKQNEGLRAMVEERDMQIKQLEGLLAQARNDYDSLKLAKMLEITNGDWETAQKRLAKLIRDVNKCITLVSEK